MYVCMCVYVCIYIYMCVCVCVYVCIMYARMYVCIYLFELFVNSGLGYGGSEKGALNLQFSATRTNT